MAVVFDPFTGQLKYSTLLDVKIYKPATQSFYIGDVGTPNTGINTTSIGHNALLNANDVEDSVFIGNLSGSNINGGSLNTCVGSESCAAGTGTFTENTAIGYGSLSFCSGSRNTSLGSRSGVCAINSSGSLYLGNWAGFFGADTDNVMWIANTLAGVGSNLITGRFDLGQVGINLDPTAIKASAIFQIGGTNGFLYGPQLTTTQRNAVTPDEGAELYNKTTHTKQFWNGSSWVDMIGTGGGSMALSIVTVTANYTITTEDVVIVNASTPVNITLPASYTKRLTIKQIGSADATVIGGTMDGNNVLHGGTTSAMSLIFDSTNWWQI